MSAIAERGSDLPALHRLFGYYDEIERASRAFRRERFIEGGNGFPRLNPLAEQVTRLEPLVRALEDRFGLTPLARLKLGVTFADAHRSLEELNASFDTDTQGPDPRLGVVGGDASA